MKSVLQKRLETCIKLAVKINEKTKLAAFVEYAGHVEWFNFYVRAGKTAPMYSIQVYGECYDRISSETTDEFFESVVLDIQDIIKKSDKIYLEHAIKIYSEGERWVSIPEDNPVGIKHTGCHRLEFFLDRYKNNAKVIHYVIQRHNLYK